MEDIRNNKDMDTLKSSDQIYKVKIEDLEKQLENKNFKIESLRKELQSRSDELVLQSEKYQKAREARDDNKFRVVKLEGIVNVLRNENENLECQLKDQKEIKKSNELSLEVVIASYEDQIKNYQEKLKACESKVFPLTTDKSSSSSPMEVSFERRNIVINSEGTRKILQLENDIKFLSLENEDLKSKLREEVEKKNAQIQTLESCTDKFQKLEEIVKEYESRIINLEAEKKEMVCRSEGQLNEIKKLQIQLESHQHHEKKFQEENSQLQKELEKLKSACVKKQIQAEISETMPGKSVSKGVLELRECKSILTSFAEEHRNLQMKFEQEMIEKLQNIQETISVADKERDILLVCSPAKIQDTQLSVAGIPKESVEKEDSSVHIPLKSKNRRQQKTANPEVKKLQENVDKDNSVRSPLKPQNSRQQKTAKPEMKKNIKKTKKTKDENVCSPNSPKNSVPENIKTAMEAVSPIVKEGRQLRTRKKV